MSDADGRVTLECDWSLLKSRTRKILAQRHERLTEQAGSGSADAAVPTMSRLLVTFSDRIACGSHDPSALVSGSTPP
jgi:ABC-type transport auxiliary lipoprotein component